MPLRSLLEPALETVNDLVLAAEERYWDAYELAVQGRAFAAIYVAGFTAEMLLKVAGFRFDGAAPGDAIQPRLGPAKTYGAVRFPAIEPVGYQLSAVLDGVPRAQARRRGPTASPRDPRGVTDQDGSSVRDMVDLPPVPRLRARRDDGAG